MTITEVLTIIQEERIQLEVYEELHKWLMNDRTEWIDRAMNSESTVRAINKIATGSKSTANNKLKDIINLSEEDD